MKTKRFRLLMDTSHSLVAIRGMLMKDVSTYGFIILILMMLPITTFGNERVKVSGLWFEIDNTKQEASLTYEYENSMDNYSRLKGEIVIPSIIYPISGGSYHVTRLGKQCFSHAEGITSIILPSTIEELGDRAFSLMHHLKKITIPSSVKRYGHLVFEQNYELERINIDDIASWVQMQSLYPEKEPNCGYDLDPFSHNRTLIDGISYTKTGLYINDQLVEDIIIPDGVSTIRTYAFWGYSIAKSLSIPSSVVEIKGYSFAHCGGLKDLFIPKNVDIIGDDAFSYCKGLETVTIEGSTKNFKESFCGTSMKELTFLGEINGFSSFCFYNNKNLERINIPSLEKWLDIDINGTLSSPLSNPSATLYVNGTAITNLTIPEGYEIVKEGIFYNYNSLKSVTFPSTTLEIEDFALYTTQKLEKVESKAVTPPSSSSKYIFGESTYESCPLYVPQESLNSYKNKYPWSLFKNIISSTPSSIAIPKADNYIESNVFNINGQRLARPQKGINIVNGHKVIH